MAGLVTVSPVRTADNSPLVITGASSAGKVLTGTGPNAASWQPAPAGGGGGGGPLGTARAVAWGYTEQNTGSNSQTRPANGWTFSDVVPGGPTLSVGGPYELTDKATDPTYGWSQANFVTLMVAEAGWYDARLFFEARFDASPPVNVTIGFNYPGQGFDAYPTWKVPNEQLSNGIQAFGYGLIYLPAAAELDFYCQWGSSQSIAGSQFTLDLTRF